MGQVFRNFKQGLEALPAWPRQGTVVLAVSAGVDSMVLWNLMFQLSELAAYQDLTLVVGHFNHGLRKESDTEEEMVHLLGRIYQVKVVSRRWENPAGQASEAAARTARYGFLADLCRDSGADLLLTGHHLDDANETFMMRLIRGASLQGLRSIATDRQLRLTTTDQENLNIRLIRPLLTLTKEDLYAYAKRLKIPYAEDATNQELYYQRNRIRHQVLPLLQAENPQANHHLRSAQEEIQRAYAVLLEDFQAFEAEFIQYEDQLMTWDLSQWGSLSSSRQLTYLTLFFEEHFVHYHPHYSHRQIQAIYQLTQGSGSPSKHLSLGNHWQCDYDGQTLNFSRQV